MAAGLANGLAPAGIAVPDEGLTGPGVGGDWILEGGGGGGGIDEDLGGGGAGDLALMGTIFGAIGSSSSKAEDFFAGVRSTGSEGAT